MNRTLTAWVPRDDVHWIREALRRAIRSLEAEEQAKGFLLPSAQLATWRQALDELEGSR